MAQVLNWSRDIIPLRHQIKYVGELHCPGYEPFRRRIKRRVRGGIEERPSSPCEALRWKCKHAKFYSIRTIVINLDELKRGWEQPSQSCQRTKVTDKLMRHLPRAGDA
jgi:hypothetical protein